MRWKLSSVVGTLSSGACSVKGNQNEEYQCEQPIDDVACKSGVLGWETVAKVELDHEGHFRCAPNPKSDCRPEQSVSDLQSFMSVQKSLPLLKKSLTSVISPVTELLIHIFKLAKTVARKPMQNWMP